MHRKRARRLSPRFVASRMAIDEDAKELTREMDDYLVQSTTELEKMLQARRAAWNAADANVEHGVMRLPQRERLVIQCLLVRDLYYVMELYATHLNALVSSSEVSVPLARAEPEQREAPFSEWLFSK